MKCNLVKSDQEYKYHLSESFMFDDNGMFRELMNEFSETSCSAVVLDLSKKTQASSFYAPPNSSYGHRLVIDLAEPSIDSSSNSFTRSMYGSSVRALRQLSSTNSRSGRRRKNSTRASVEAGRSPRNDIRSTK